jgi:hypothetical protein
VSEPGNAPEYVASARGARRPARRASAHGRSEASPEANARLTAATGALLLLVTAAEGVTILRIRPLLVAHVFLGVLLVPPVLLKVATTTWRAARYYLGSPAYRRKGPPPLVLRLLGPLVVVLTVAVLASGIALLFVPTSDRALMLTAHKATFVLWFGAMTIHVLGHLLDTASIAPRDYLRRTRRQVRGASSRQWALAAALAAGLVLAAVLTPSTTSWLHTAVSR